MLTLIAFAFGGLVFVLGYSAGATAERRIWQAKYGHLERRGS